MLKRRLSNVIILLFISIGGSADTPVSPFNKRKIDVTDSTAGYSFLVSGHFHGASTNRSGYPASTILAGIDTFNALKPALLVSLGDLFLYVDEQTVRNYSRSFFSKLSFPLYNAVGNHDVHTELYSQLYGSTSLSFILPGAAFVILDTEQNDGSIKGDQLKMLSEACNRVKQDTGLKNLFIFSHRPVWSESDEELNKLLADNTKSLIKNNYRSEVYPLISELAGTKNVFWFAGSMGGLAPSSFLYHEQDKVRFIITSVRDLPRDAVLKVNVEKARVSFQPVSLQGQKLLPLEEYNISYWQKNRKIEPGFNMRLLPYYTIQALKHRYFWIGFACSLVLMLFVYLLVRRKSRR